jgi:hypothetical protein
LPQASTFTTKGTKKPNPYQARDVNRYKHFFTERFFFPLAVRGVGTPA